MKEVNGKKYVSLLELMEHVNKYIRENNVYARPERQEGEMPYLDSELGYSEFEMVYCWSMAMVKYYDEFQKPVEKGIHYIDDNSTGEWLVSLDGVKLMEKYAVYDGHDEPLISREGAAELFK